MKRNFIQRAYSASVSDLKIIAAAVLFVLGSATARAEERGVELGRCDLATPYFCIGQSIHKYKKLLVQERGGLHPPTYTLKVFDRKKIVESARISPIFLSAQELYERFGCDAVDDVVVRECISRTRGTESYLIAKSNGWLPNRNDKGARLYSGIFVLRFRKMAGYDIGDLYLPRESDGR